MRWVGENVAEGDAALVNFLAHLTNLQHLSLQGFNSSGTYYVLELADRGFWYDLDLVMRELTSLKLTNVKGAFWERACPGATALQ